MNKLLLAACVSTFAISSVHAASLVTNGDFEQTTNGVGQINNHTQATGWTIPGTSDGNGGYTFLMDGTADSAGAEGQYGTLKLWGPANGSANGFVASPTGGNFLASDGAYIVEPIEQMINGLVAGQLYTVGFNWGGIQQFGYDGAQSEQFAVSLGGDTQYTPVYSNTSHGFSGWRHQDFTFKATGPSEMLSFLAVGAPAGVPPFSVLDSVTLAAPEPATWAMMVIGFGVIGGAMRRRTRTNQTLAAA